MFTFLEERARRLLATLTAAALLAGLSVIGVLTPAQAADGPVANPVVTATPNADVDPDVETTLTISGTGFVGAPAQFGVYFAVGETSAWSGNSAFPAQGWLTFGHVPAIVDGAFTKTVTLPAGSFDASKTYQVVTSAAHHLSVSDRSFDSFTPIAIAQPVPVADPVVTVKPGADIDPGAATTLTISGTGFVGTPAQLGVYFAVGETSVWSGNSAFPAQGWLKFGHVPTIVDGAFTTTVALPAGTFDASKTYQVVTSAAHHLSVSDRTFDSFTSIAIRQPLPVGAPQIQVFAADGVTPLGTTPVALGDTIVVKGSGFDPESNRAPEGNRPPITAGNPAGNYVVFGKFADTWSPYDGAPSTARFVGDQKWALSDAAFALVAPRYQPSVAAQRAVIAPDGTFTTTLTIKKKTDTSGELAWPDTGNFGVYTYAAGGTTNQAQELKAPVNFAESVPSTPAAATTLAISAAPTTVTAGSTSSLIATVTPAEAAGTVEFYSGDALVGSAPLTQGVANLKTGALPAGEHAFTARFVPADAALYTASATTTGVTVTAKAAVDGGTVTPPASAAGQLVWGVKASFTSYITGSGAAGTVSVSGGAAVSGSSFTFSQATKDFNGSTGTVGYAGAVRFTGHHGALDLKLSNPTIKVTGPGSGVLIVDVVGKGLTGGSVDKVGVEFATLNLAAPTTADGATTWSNAAATLTAAGSEAFSGFYPAGTALDPVSFTVGADKAPGETPAETPPAAVAPLAPGTYPNATASVATILPGGEVTVTGTGFGANTTGIELAVYSVRQVLATGLVADANGTVTATVKLPANLAAGVHTLSFEANGVKSQTTITVEAPAVAVKQCVANAVSGASLSWGVKSAFRTYITGPIANGTVSATGVTDTGSTFRWAGGTGKFNTEANAGRVAFGGSVNFSGHGGILDLTLSNVRIQVTSASTGTLIADVSSTDMAGTKTSQSGVTVASLSLAGTKSTSGNTVTWTNASASLTAAGAKAFAGSYVAGEALDPVTFSFPLGGTVECDASSGALASTGADGLADAALLALAAMTFGLGLVLVTRRRRTPVRIG